MQIYVKQRITAVHVVQDEDAVEEEEKLWNEIPEAESSKRKKESSNLKSLTKKKREE